MNFIYNGKNKNNANIYIKLEMEASCVHVSNPYFNLYETNTSDGMTINRVYVSYKINKTKQCIAMNGRN